MKLWYDDKKIPMWAEWLTVFAVAVVAGVCIGFILLGYNLAFLIN